VISRRIPTSRTGRNPSVSQKQLLFSLGTDAAFQDFYRRIPPVDTPQSHPNGQQAPWQRPPGTPRALRGLSPGEHATHVLAGKLANPGAAEVCIRRMAAAANTAWNRRKPGKPNGPIAGESRPRRPTSNSVNLHTINDISKRAVATGSVNAGDASAADSRPQSGEIPCKQGRSPP
jgi:hypothetical protein